MPPACLRLTRASTKRRRWSKRWWRSTMCWSWPVGPAARGAGVRVVIASAERPDVLRDAVAGTPGVGTFVKPRLARLPARKLWIAFALAATGTVVVDDGAKK